MTKTNNSPSSILKELDNVLREGYSPFPVFNDWLDLMLYALMRDDENYLNIVRKYKNTQTKGKREIDYFCNAFGSLMIQMKQTNSELLGDLYMNWNMSNNYRGQYFTPAHIARFMAEILSPKGETIIDPCCGAGIMLIESIKAMNKDSINAATFFGQDIDLTCVKMTALNLCFFNVKGYVIWGDTIKSECLKVYQTSSSALGGAIRELKGKDFEDFKDWYCPKLEKSVKEDKNISEQFSLFSSDKE